MTKKISYKIAAFLRVLPMRCRRGSFAYKMAAFLRVLPTRWRLGNFAYKMAAFLGVLPTKWRQCRVFGEFYPQDGGVGNLRTRWQRF